MQRAYNRSFKKGSMSAEIRLKNLADNKEHNTCSKSKAIGKQNAASCNNGDPRKFKKIWFME